MPIESPATRLKLAELERAARIHQLGEMAAGLAHEINQPLAAITYTLSGALRRARNGEINNAQVIEMLQTAIDQIHRAASIITRMRGLVTRQTPGKARVCLNEVVREMLELSRIGNTKRPVDLVEELAPDLPPVLGDKVQLEQVVLNLLANAIHAAHQTPQREARVVLSTASDGQTVDLRVWDNGPSLTPAHRQRMFEPFFTTKSDGIGLGLAICQTITEDHGGRIWAEPTVEGGLRLNLRLPAAEELQ